MKKRTATILLVLVAVAAVVALGTWLLGGRGPEEREEVAAFLRLAVEDGAVRTYAFEATGESEIDVAAVNASLPQAAPAPRPAGEMTLVRLEASGVFHIKFYGGEEEGWDAAGAVTGLALRINGQAPDYAGQVARPLSFRLSPRGEISGLRFSTGTEQLALAFVERLVLAMQVVLPPTPGERVWQEVENDASGRMSADYALVAAEEDTLAVRKQVRDYLELAEELQNVPLMADTLISVDQSETVASLSAGRWIIELVHEEKLSFSAGARIWSRSVSRLTLKERSGDEPYRFPDHFPAFEDEVQAQKYVDEAFTRTDPALDRLGAGLDVDGALAEYEKLAASGDRNAAERFLVNYLRQYPESPAELLRTLDADPGYGRFDEKTQLVLWRLVTEAGTPEAQRAVMEAATDPTYGQGSHVRALMYVGDFENPHRFLLEGLWRLHRDPGLNGDPGMADVVENMSLFAVGSLGYREKRNEEAKALATGELADNLRRSAGDPGETALIPMAMGNTGNDMLLDTVKPYFSDKDESVRAAACVAVRRMPAPAAQQALIGAYQHDGSEKVRQAALKSLLEMPLTAESAAWGREQVREARPEGEQVLLVELLGGNLASYPSNEASLRELLETMLGRTPGLMSQ